MGRKGRKAGWPACTSMAVPVRPTAPKAPPPRLPPAHPPAAPTPHPPSRHPSGCTASPRCPVPPRRRPASAAPTPPPSTSPPPTMPSTPAATSPPPRPPFKTGLHASAAGRCACAGAARGRVLAPQIPAAAAGCCCPCARCPPTHTHPLIPPPPPHGAPVQGAAGRAPSASELAAALQSRQFFVYCGHGGGEQYIPGTLTSRQALDFTPCAGCMERGARGGGGAHHRRLAPPDHTNTHTRSPTLHPPTQPASCAGWTAVPARC